MNDVIDKAKKMIENVGELPPIPSVILKTLELLNDSNATLKKVQEEILKDPALTAFLLKVSNSSLYGLRREITTITHAVNLIGYDAVRSIILSYMTKEFHKGASKMIQNTMWKHSFSTAIIAKKIAEYIKIDPEEAFITGLLHDIGKGVILKNKPTEFNEIIELIFNENLCSIDAEKKVLEYTHVEIGYLLMKKWGFSEKIVESLIYHNDLVDYTGENLLVPISSLANKLSHLNEFSFTKWFNRWEEDMVELTILNLSESEMENIVEKAIPEIAANLDSL